MRDIEKIKQYTFDLMAVYKYKCSRCKKEFASAVSTSDTDMVPMLLDSVYCPKSNTLAIAEITDEEFYNSCKDSMPKRIGKAFNGQEFFYIDYHKICPLCNGKLEESKSIKLNQYIKENPSVYLFYFDENGNIQKESLSQRDK